MKKNLIFDKKKIEIYINAHRWFTINSDFIICRISFSTRFHDSEEDYFISDLIFTYFLRVKRL